MGSALASRLDGAPVRAFLRPLAGYAIPLTLGQLGQMGMILIDLFMVGKLGPAAIAGVGLGSSYFYVYSLYGAGILFGLDYFVSHASGRDNARECRQWLVQGLWMAALLAVPLTIFGVLLSQVLMPACFAPELAGPANAFATTLSFSLPAFFAFVTIRAYLQATGSARAGTVVTALGLLACVGFNQLFIFGGGGVPALGVAGTGIATTCTRTLMALALAGFMWWRDRQKPLVPLRPDREALLKLFKLGNPIGLQLGLEVGVFSLVAFMIGRFGPVATAAHTLVANLAGFTYTVPMGIAGAAAIMVGQATGASKPAVARRAGWVAIGVGTSIMAMIGLALGLEGHLIAGLFSVDAGVIALAGQLIWLVALFQVADGVQSVGGGALRGVGNTRASMIANMVGYWVVGVPVGAYFCFVRHLGAVGFWIGLTAGLFSVAAVILRSWARHAAPVPGKEESQPIEQEVTP